MMKKEIKADLSEEGKWLKMVFLSPKSSFPKVAGKNKTSSLCFGSMYCCYHQLCLFFPYMDERILNAYSQWKNMHAEKSVSLTNQKLVEFCGILLALFYPGETCIINCSCFRQTYFHWFQGMKDRICPTVVMAVTVFPLTIM